MRLAWLQIVKGEELQLRAENNRMRGIEVKAKRGTIYDRNGKELAVSISADTVIAIPPQVRNSKRPEEIARTLAAILELDYDKVFERITKFSSYEFVQRKIDFDKARQIKELNLPGIRIIEENQRFYPKGSLAAHILGFAGIDNQGLEGIEVTYEEKLKGVSGRIEVEYDARGREIPHATHAYIPPQAGYNLILTIDEVIQYIVERELDKVIQSTQAKSATIILMDPKTGGILALASRPTYDPNQFGSFPSSNWRNIALSNSYEPGSTFKIITLAAAIEEGLFDPNRTFHDSGSIKVGAETIRCWRAGGHGTQTFKEVVENSCNPGFITLGLRLEEKNKGLLYQYIKGFGFGSPTGIKLPGEAKGIMIPEKDLKLINVATISMGQAIAITPLQLVAAVAAIANDGLLLEPQLVKEIRDAEGRLIEAFNPNPVRQVLAKQTAALTREMLESVVTSGTGRNTYLPGYRVAGKTGTAQKAEGGRYAQGKYIASFVGFAPADNPLVVGVVVIDEPVGPYYGGQIAAPVFKSVIEDVLRYLEVEPKYTPEELKTREKSQQSLVTVPDIRNLTKTEAEQKLKASGLMVRFSGEGEKVVAQIPAAHARVQPQTRVVIYLDKKSDSLDYNNNVVVPDITGLAIREVAEVFNALGIKLEIGQGSTGIAVQQSISPGSRVPRGTVVKVLFTSPAGAEEAFAGP
jgi:stage V sporulation protein D (sporulation-specific penicillin-binding protein)